MVVPSVDQLKALLQLKDSSLDEFIKLVESARGAARSETTMENCKQNDGDRLSMDTLSLSDTSMMAHEVDRQLEKSTPESQCSMMARKVYCQLEESKPESQDGNSGYHVSPADSSTN